MGGTLWLPFAIVLPFWLSLTLPQVLGAVFATSLAYLVAGPTRASLSLVMLLSSLVAAICAAVNLVLFMGMVPGVVSTDDLAPPGGMITLLVDALVIGTVTGLVSLRGEYREPRDGRTPLLIALFVSVVAVLLLLTEVGTLISIVWFGPEPNV